MPLPHPFLADHDLLLPGLGNVGLSLIVLRISEPLAIVLSESLHDIVVEELAGVLDLVPPQARVDLLQEACIGVEKEPAPRKVVLAYEVGGLTLGLQEGEAEVRARAIAHSDDEATDH